MQYINDRTARLLTFFVYLQALTITNKYSQSPAVFNYLFYLSTPCPAMAPEDWRQDIISRFFAKPKSLTQEECDGLAKAITGAADIRRVSLPGSFSYTVICVKESGKEAVSFREQGNKLDEQTVSLAKHIHGNLVPTFTYHGLVEGADRPLFIYVMPYLPGVSCFEGLECEVELNSESEARHIQFIHHLARYVSRSP